MYCLFAEAKDWNLIIEKVIISVRSKMDMPRVLINISKCAKRDSSNRSFLTVIK